jgi:hypothetical protein
MMRPLAVSGWNSPKYGYVPGFNGANTKGRVTLSPITDSFLSS